LVSTNTRQTASGINYVDGTNLTGKDAIAARNAANAKGLPYLDKTSADLQNNVETTRQNMTNILSTLEGVSPQGPISRVAEYPQRMLSSIFQTNDQVASFAAYRSAAIQALRSMAGAKGLRINQAEIMQSVNNDIPTINDTIDTAKSKIAKVNSMLDSQEKGLFGSQYYKPTSGAAGASAGAAPAVDLSGTTFTGLVATVPGQGTLTFPDQASLDAFKKDNNLQ
jgi:hypothetical protein